MFESRKKIRQLNAELEAQKKRPEIVELTEALDANKPAQPSGNFQENLKKQLLNAHKSMAKAQKETEKNEKKFSLWSDFRIKGLVTALGLLVLIVLAGVVAYPMIPAPTVQGYVLKNNVRTISLNAPLKITFSQPMDNSSVEKGFKVDPALPGKFSWKGNTLNYMPDSPFKIGDTYKVTIAGEAKSLLQKPLGAEYSEYYKIVQAPQVILLTPNDQSTEQPKDQRITIMFDRPMTGLTGLEAGEANFPAVAVTPAVEGKWKWLGTSALELIPTNGLKLSTHYTVTVPAGTVSLDGGSTDKEFKSQFDTVRPMVTGLVSTDGGDSTDFSPNSHLKLSFNQQVDLGSARNLIKLQKIVDGKATDVPANMEYFTMNDWDAEQAVENDHVEMSQVDEISEDNSDAKTAVIPNPPVVEKPKPEELLQSLVISPNQALEGGAKYTLMIPAGVKGASGELVSNQDNPINFEVAGNLSLLSSNAFDTQYNELAYPIFTFNNALDMRSFRNKVTITPANKAENGKDITPTIAAYEQTSVYIGYDFLPATEYKITIAQGVKDIFGSTINQPLELSFKTPNYKPNLSLESGTDINVLDGTKPSIFYISSVNINHADIALKKLSEEDFRKFYGNGYVDYQNVNFTTEQFEKHGTLDVKLALNERGHTQLNLDSLFGEKLAAGFYYMEISNNEAKDADCNDPKSCSNGVKKEKLIFSVNKSSLAVKMSLDQMMVWATGMNDGQPVAGMHVRAVDVNGKEVASGDTNFEGIVKLDISKAKSTTGSYTDYTVIGTKGDDMTMAHTTWSEGVAPWNFNINADAYSPEYYSYVYTDRPIYRPDQEVFFKGIIRQEQEYNFKIPDITKANVVIYDSNGAQILNKDESLNKNGTFSDSIKLGTNIATGEYDMTVTLLGAKGPDWANRFYSSFKVYEYRKPEYKLDITPDKKDYVNGDKATVKIESGYFFGAPLPDANVKWTVKAQDYYFILPDELVSKFGGSWFSFAEDGFFCYWGCQGGSEIVAQGNVKTDANGLANVQLPLEIGDKKMSQIYTLEATVSDANNQSVSNRITFPVHRGGVYLGVRSQDYIATSGKPAKFDVLSVTTDGKVMPGQAVEAALYKRDWNTVKRRNVDGGFYYENNYNDTLVEKKNLQTGSDGLGSFEFNLKDGGTFKVEVTANDSRNNAVKSSTTIYVSSGSYINWGSENNDKIELVTDKMEYKIGDTAKVLIKSPYKGVNALVTFEKDKVLDQKIIKLDSNSQTFEVPITDKYLPNVFVSVVVMKGSNYDAGLVQPAVGGPDERQVAAFKVGYATLPVNTDSKKLNIAISSDKARYNPGDEVKLTVKSTDIYGKGIPAEVSVGVVDESVLSLTESVTADLLNVFYRQRMLGVMFADTLTKAISRVNVQVEAGMKGGGGGAIAKRGDFKDTAYFSAVVNTNADGSATVSFKLPDNLTTWQAMAIGISDDTKNAQALVGSGQYSFLSNKDIMVRPVLPRFMVTGDKMTVSAIVQNYTSKDADMKVTLAAKGVDLNDAADKNMTIKAGGSQKIDWQIEVGAASEAGASLDFIAVANGGERGDDVTQVLPVKEATFPSFVATSKVITDDTKQIDQVWIPAGINVNKGKLSIEFNPTLAGSINDGLQYLMTYPYGCTEQLASAILPDLVLKELIDTKKFDTTAIKMPDLNELNKNVQAGLQQIYQNQQANGGFGLWLESNDNAYLTAYVVETMHEAQGAGYTVDKNVMDNAVGYLSKWINNNPITSTVKNDSADGMIRFNANNRAYMLYVLSEVGKGDLGLSNNLYTSKDKLSLISKAYLAMTLKNLNSTKVDAATTDKINQLVKELENAAIQDPRGVSFQEANLDFTLFDSNTRTTAVVMKALNRISPENPLIAKILQSLLRERQAGHFATTQETAVSLLALIEYFNTSKELSPAYNGVVTINGKEVLSKNYTSANLFDTAKVEIALKDLLPNNLDNEVAAQKTGNGKMYMDMNLEYYLPLDQQRAENQGIEVNQEYFAQNDTKLEAPVTSAKVGDNLHGRMTIVVPQDRHYVMLEDFLPAGLEGIDFNLKTSDQSICSSNDDCANVEANDNSWYFNHSEVHDDRVMYFADYLPKGVYEIDYYVRATSVGQFADLPAMAQETYFPEVFGRTAGQKFEVKQ